MPDDFPHVDYTCVDCGELITLLGQTEAPVPARCAICQWIAEFVDPADYASVRAFLSVRD